MILLTFLILLLVTIDLLVSRMTRRKIYDTPEDLPRSAAGLIPGTVRTLPNGNINLYYRYRIDAAEMVFKSGKVDILLASGHSDGRGYNEPEEMKNDLISRGIPEEKIVTDPEGSRTVDSVVRAKEVFGYGSMIVISQKFHNERAVFIAGRKGIEAAGFNAEDPPPKAALKTRIREVFARVRMIWDLL